MVKKNRADNEHLKMVRSLPCLHCGGNAEPHHLLYVPQEVHKAYGYRYLRGVGMRAPDMFSIPICRQIHDEIHKMGTDKWLFKAYELAIQINQNKKNRDACMDAINDYRRRHYEVHNNKR